MLRYLDQTVTILMSDFLRFGTLFCFTGDCFVIRINKVTYSNKNGMFYLCQYFYNTFPRASFPNSFEQGGVQMVFG